MPSVLKTPDRLQFSYGSVKRWDVGAYETMPTDETDARVLLRAAPDDYVAERVRLVKQARAEGDRTRAGFYQSLKHPSRSLWAVLAAGDDVDAVRGIVAITTELAEIQAARGAAGVVSAASQRRRKALEALVDRAVTALARWDSGAAARRPEIRSIVDLLSRHPDLADSWIDATLRDLPDDAFGFAAFADVEVTAPSHADTPAKARRSRGATSSPSPATGEESSDRTAQRAAERSARADQARRARQARQDVAGAARDLAAAERRVDVARRAVREAEDALRLAEDGRAAAEKRHQKANAVLEAIRAE